uniref:DUF223 domain-containing protein n=1 Tax=Brassica oleracea var. oleracea TaxID=109376 RepID=A0A0D3A0Y1_BRAOL
FSNRRPGVRHSTFESLRLGRSSQSIAFGFLSFWDSLNFKKDKEFVGITVLFLDKKLNSVIQGFTPVRRPNHYMSSLKEGSTVKVDHFEVARCSSMYTITDHPFLVQLISPFQAEQQMKANFSGSSSTSKQNQKIDVGGRLIKGILQRNKTS